MWVLISQEDSNVKYTLLCGQDYRIGRADADILLPTDKSISRSHAFLKITHLDVTQPHKLPILTLTDSSRFGSVVAGEKFKGGTKDVNSGNIIKFGTQNSTFKTWYDSFVITTSCLDESGKREMKQFMLTLGGHVVKEWRKECKLLVMSQLSVTVKVICALIDQRPIVTPKYLVSLIEALKTNSKEPDEDEFLPPIAESQLNPNEVSFKRDERRKTLFQGKVFIFLSPKQFKKLSMAVELAGGTPMLMEEGTDNNEDDFLISPDTCVMYSDMNDRSTNYSQNAKDWAKHVENLLKRNKKRTINDAELGYAVLHCSTQKHCNPDVADTGEAAVPLPTQSLSVPPITSQVSEQRDEVRVSETQQTTARSRRSTAGSNKSNVSVVDNSFVPDTEKRKSSSGTSAIDSPARPTRSNISAVVKETPSQKRKRELEDVDDVPEPKVSKKGHIEVKEEPITPSKSATATTRLTRASERSALQGATNRNTKGGGASVKAETLSDDDERKEIHGGRRRGRNSRSPSPAAPEVVTRSKRSPARKAPKVEIDVSQDVDAMFDSIPSRRRLRRERSPSPKPAEVESPKPTRSRVAPVIDSCTNIDDAFDTIPSQRRGRRSPSPSPDPVLIKPESSQKDTRTRVVPVIEENPNIDDAFDNMPGRRGRRTKQRSPTPPPRPANLKTTDSAVPKSGPQRSQKQNVQVKSEPVTPAKPTIAELNRQSTEANDRTSDVPTGFLTTTKPIRNQKCKIDEDYKIDDPVDRGVMVVKEISMVVPANNRPQGRNRQSNLNDGTCMWKGKVVKNFKKFRKTANAGATGLPRIIGGADLIMHKDAPNKDKEQWLQELAEAESQQNEQEEIARQLFDWEPSSRRGKVGRR